MWLKEAFTRQERRGMSVFTRGFRLFDFPKSLLLLIAVSAIFSGLGMLSVRDGYYPPDSSVFTPEASGLFFIGIAGGLLLSTVPLILIREIFLLVLGLGGKENKSYSVIIKMIFALAIFLPLVKFTDWQVAAIVMSLLITRSAANHFSWRVVKIYEIPANRSNLPYAYMTAMVVPTVIGLVIGIIYSTVYNPDMSMFIGAASGALAGGIICGNASSANYFINK